MCTFSLLEKVGHFRTLCKLNLVQKLQRSNQFSKFSKPKRPDGADPFSNRKRTPHNSNSENKNPAIFSNKNQNLKDQVHWSSSRFRKSQASKIRVGKSDGLKFLKDAPPKRPDYNREASSDSDSVFNVPIRTTPLRYGLQRRWTHFFGFK